MARILIVEDERSIRQALCFELEDEGYNVHFASDFPEAANALNAFDYDIIISDIYLDSGNGLQLMEMVKQKNKNIPFIVMTAYPHSDLALQIKEMVQDRFFEKPFFAPLLKEKISELLSHNLVKTKAATRAAYCS